MEYQSGYQDRKYSVYWCPSTRRYVVKQGSRTVLTTTRHDRAHEFLARNMPDHFTFYFVFTQPDVKAKASALAQLLDLMPELRSRIGILVSYALIDNATLECVRTLKEQYRIQVMLDSGAFHVLAKKVPLEKYLSWIRDYAEFANRHLDLFDWVVIPDVPCDSRPAEEVQKLPNIQKILITVENAVRFSELLSDPRKLVVVVQGYFPNEYAVCCQLLIQHRLVTARVGVGSLCVRKYDGSTVKDVTEILRTVRKLLPG